MENNNLKQKDELYSVEEIELYYGDSIQKLASYYNVSVNDKFEVYRNNMKANKLASLMDVFGFMMNCEVDKNDELVIIATLNGNELIIDDAAMRFLNTNSFSSAGITFVLK